MRTRLVFFVAVAALIIGLLGVIDLLKPDPKPIETDTVVAEKSEGYVGVWFTTEAFEKGEAINAQGVVKQQLPLSEAIKLGVRQEVQISFSPSTLLNRSLSTGDVVLPEYQVSPNKPGYIDLLVAEGMTLYPLKVSDKNLINDYIRPGSLIDVLTVSSPRTNCQY